MSKIKSVYLFLCMSALQMVHAAKEIEFKISITEDQYVFLQNWLTENAVYKGTSAQTEYYLTKPEVVWDESKGFKDTLETIRVRCEAKGDSVCYKYAHIDPAAGRPTYRDEYETRVQDGQMMLKILAFMGYSQYTVVSKKLTTYLVRNTFEVVLDDVQGVGKFVEIELKIAVDTVQEGIDALENMLRQIGITQFTQYSRGYIHMIWNPTYDFGTMRDLNKK